ncbi:MAG: hypothetical protein JW800_04150 [Candidatus Omnitrophica bacterium]|nr:hypothetical protein [Candidatus Omnitrophota bacterium]
MNMARVIRIKRSREKGDNVIGRGKAAKVYKLNHKYELIRKEFAPIVPVKIWNWFFFESPHPLTTEAGHIYAFWKRRLAHRMCKCLNSDVRIPDALDLTKGGFTTEFILEKFTPPGRRRKLYHSVKTLESFFKYVGLPTWSFSRKNPFSRSNFIFVGDIVHIIDYEQSVPVRNSKGVIDYDRIHFEDLHDYISGNEKLLLNRLGLEDVKHLHEALERAKEYQARLDLRPKWGHSKSKSKSKR